MRTQEQNYRVGCGCLPPILTILALWALWFGLPTPWGKYNIDIFPPRVWEMNTGAGK